MTQNAATPEEAAPRRPVLVIVDADHQARAALEAALLRRFGADYQVLVAESAEAGLAALERLAKEGEQVPLVAADLGLPGIGGVGFLDRAHAVYPGASRALLLAMEPRGTRIPFGVLPVVQRATALGQIDFSILKGWVTPEEWLYPQVQAALSTWTTANRPHHEVVRIVGERWSLRSHELRDSLARNTVPLGFYPVDSDEGRRLVHEYGVDVTRLPAAIFHDGLVLHQPTLADGAAALGLHTRPSSETYELAIIGSGPAGLAAAVYGASEGLRTLLTECQSIGGHPLGGARPRGARPSPSFADLRGRAGVRGGAPLCKK